MNQFPSASLPSLRAWRSLLTTRRIILLLSVYALIGLVLLAVRSAARGILFREYQTKTRQLAQLIASEIWEPDLAGIRGPEDMGSYAYRKVLEQLQDIKKIYGDVAFIYILRRSPATGEWTFVVDANPLDSDRNNDGVISPSEEGVLPGKEYPEAKTNPKILKALEAPTAEDDFTSDYWGTFISGYAPIRDPFSGDSVAVLGVDVGKATFEQKYSAVRIATLASFLVLVGLTTFAFLAYIAQSETLRLVRVLDREIEEKNAELEETVGRLLERDRSMSRDLSLAREVQERFLPEEFPLPDDLRFAAQYRASAEIGGDLYDAFPIDERSAGLYVADVVGHGVSAALVTAALKASIERSRQAIFQRYYRTMDLQTPLESAALERFLEELNRAMGTILPATAFLSFQMAVFLPDREEMLVGNAGHPPPLLWEASKSRVRVVQVPANLAIGVSQRTSFRTIEIRLQPGDKAIFYTDGLLERMNPKGETFGMERFLDCIRNTGALPPADLLDRVNACTADFSRGTAPHDDEAVVIVELLEREETPQGPDSAG